MNNLIIISGPTASGKTRISIELALHIQQNLKLKVAIVNFDSLLFYQELNIATAKPTLEERQNIEHFLIDIVSIQSPLNASDFIERAKKQIEELHRENYVIILVGGSAFYLRALLKGMYQLNSTDDLTQDKQDIKDEFNKIYQKEGIQYFIDYLKQHDPQSLINLHPNDHYRLMRAVEFFELTKSKISEQKKLLDELNPYDLSNNIHDWNVIHFYLDLPKDEHQKIIEKRTEKMIQMGLIDEIKSILERGFDPQLKPLQSIGPKETIDFIQEKYSSINEYSERICISTRQLAKSQRTFFKKIKPKIECHPLIDQEKIFKETDLFLQKKANI